MKESNHLTRIEIAAFAAKTLSVDERRIAGGHLLRCIDCRNLLPMPTKKEFYRALFEDGDEPGDGGKD